MAKKGILLVTVLLAVLLTSGCGFFNKTKESSTVKLIVVTNNVRNTDEIVQKITGALLTQDKDAAVNELERSEENKYLAVIATRLTEDEVVSVLESEEWIKMVELNYELKMY